MEKIPLSIVHYSKYDPRTTVGGVQRFARNLELIFEEVRFMTPQDRDCASAIRSRIPVVCDNQRVLDWPPGHPLIGFQHGVGAVKFRATWSPSHWSLARAQRRAAARPRTLWVACAEWVGSAFQDLYGNGARHVIRYPVDTERFDGRLDNAASRLVLHDARTRHKGSALIPRIQKAFPDWRFESLACKPEDVPERMRRARAFLHLSRYEGNSLVCNEAMAMDLPCLFTRVGLFRDRGGPTEVATVGADEIYSSRGRLIEIIGSFLQTLGTQTYAPRPWVLANATLQHAQARWRQVMEDFRQLAGWDLPAGAASAR